MDGKKTFQVFHTDTDSILSQNPYQNEDFSPASADEKKSMVHMHKSVSYWQDAWRRFRKNPVSMGALIVFLVILLYSYVGPYFIEYSYEDQYRSAQKLGPMQYSETEQMVRDLVANGAEGVYATSVKSGSLTAIKKGDWYIEYKGKTYAFNVSKAIEKAVLVYRKGAEAPLTLVKIKDLEEGGTWKADTPIETTDTPAEGASEISLVKDVFPHVFGTDSAGRDLMARTMFGARVSIIIGIAAALIVLVIGSIYGSISGLAGGKTDFIMMRIVELIYSIPEVLIVLLLQVVLKDPLQAWFDANKTGFVGALGDLGSGIVSIFITFALLYWVTMGRIVRGQVLQLKKQEYVTAAVALGASNWRIIRRHLLPNAIGALVITTCLQIPSAIFLESFLSFLGLGVSAPMASLGSLCSDALESITLYPYRLVFPAVILTLIVLTLNLIGDGLRDALDPRLKK